MMQTGVVLLSQEHYEQLLHPLIVDDGGVRSDHREVRGCREAGVQLLRGGSLLKALDDVVTEEFIPILLIG